MLILAGLANRARMHKIEGVEKFVMMYGGLRGAVAFALVLLIDPHHVPQQQMFLTTTITVVYFTVFVQVCARRLCGRRLGSRYRGWLLRSWQLVTEIRKKVSFCFS